mgnify:CR=1 FL=1
MSFSMNVWGYWALHSERPWLFVYDSNLLTGSTVYGCDGNITIDLKANYENVTIHLNDILGRKIITKSYNQGQLFYLNINNADGIYFLSVITENKKVVFRLVKN